MCASHYGTGKNKCANCSISTSSLSTRFITDSKLRKSSTILSTQHSTNQIKNAGKCSYENCNNVAANLKNKCMGCNNER